MQIPLYTSKTFTVSADPYPPPTPYPDTNFAYHFRMIGTISDHYSTDSYDKDSHAFKSHNLTDNCDATVLLTFDSAIPFFIKRYSLPAYYDHFAPFMPHSTMNTTADFYCVYPYVTRSGGLAPNSKSYRLRAYINGRSLYETSDPELPGFAETYTMSFDDILPMPYNGSPSNKWLRDNGAYISFDDIQSQPDPHITSNHWGWANLDLLSPSEIANMTLPLNLNDSSVRARLDQVEVQIYHPDEYAWGENSLTEGVFGALSYEITRGDEWQGEYYYEEVPREYNMRLVNDNNPIFTGTYDEYRTYIEQNFGG